MDPTHFSLGSPTIIQMHISTHSIIDLLHENVLFGGL